MSKLKIFSGSANVPLAKEICEHLEVPLGEVKLKRFSDGEVCFQTLENVRGRDVFLIQPTGPPVAETLVELLVMIDAFKRASASRIRGPTTAVPLQHKADLRCAWLLASRFCSVLADSRLLTIRMRLFRSFGHTVYNFFLTVGGA